MANSHFTKMSRAFALITAFLIWNILEYVDCAIYDLYNTKIATSDLRWTKEPRNSWEEVSGFDRHANVIRSYQICQLSSLEKNNWLRSPFINTRGAQKVNIEIEFSIAKCDWPGADTDYCRQTFNLFYFESERDVASSTFPPWQERPYIKVDTVAANSNNEINKKTFTIGPLKSISGIYVAAQDQGACMSLIGLRVYYYYCPDTTRSLASFERTMIGKKTGSLVTVPGKCVRNAETIKATAPKYHCGSTGEWQVITGSCKCMAGYHPDSAAMACLPCPVGTFKADSGNERCTKCPANSGLVSDNTSQRTDDAITAATTTTTTTGRPLACPCRPGFARAKFEGVSQACTERPSAPILSAVEANATSASISWEEPGNLGGRTDLYYSFSCTTRFSNEQKFFEACPETVAYRIHPGNHPEGTISLSSITKFHKNRIDIVNLQPFTQYVFKVYAYNGVSEALFEVEAPHLVAELTTNESVPSPVVNIYVADTSLNSVVVNWQKPSRPRGRITGYEVEVRRRNTMSRYAHTNNMEAKDQRSKEANLIETQKTSCALEDLESNTEYLVRIRAKTSVGFGRHSAAVMFKTAKRNDVNVGKSNGDSGSGILIAAVSSVLALTVACSLLVFYYSRRRARSSKLKAKSGSRRNPPAVGRYNEVTERARPASVQRRVRAAVESLNTTYVDYPDPWSAVQHMDKEISPLFLQLHNTIGEGEFAIVYKGTLMEGSDMKAVAAKQLKDGASGKDRSNFLREACTMAQFNHPNILALKGVVTKHKPEMILSEHMENGSLLEFLKLHKGNLTIPQLLHMLRGIGNGMKYLCDMQYVHRDLAARNILVGADLVCKVSDFGLSRVLENDPRATYTTSGGKIPFRWTAPESIRFREFTPASDVWSFGIVMWEVMSYGEKPYWDMTNHEVGQSIGSGMRLPAPTGCPKALHQLMLECWSLDPTKRPTFAKIVSDLNKFIRHSSLLQARHEEEMEYTVCCSPDVRNDTFVDRSAEPFLAVPEDAGDHGNDYPASDSSSFSQDDTCSSVVATDERCLNV